MRVLLLDTNVVSILFKRAHSLHTTCLAAVRGTTLFADEQSCIHWADIVAESQIAGRPITAADAWIAATARQWSLPLVTTDYRDYEHLEDLTLIPIQ